MADIQLVNPSEDQSVPGLNMPPGTFGPPVIGEARELAADPIGFLWERYNQYGPIFKTNLGGPMVFMIGPEANRFVLRDHTDCFSWAQGWPKYVRLVWGDDVLVMKDGEEHTRLRQLFGPAFAHSTLMNVFDYAVDAADEYVEGWMASPPEEFFHEAKTVVFEWMYSWLAGDIRLIGERRTVAKKLFDEFTAIPPARHGDWRATNFRDEEGAKLRRQKMIARAMLRKHFLSLAERYRSKPEENVISLLANPTEKAAGELTDEQIADHALLFLVTGADATAVAFTWAVYELYNNPEIRDRLRADIDEVVGDERISWKHIQQLALLENYLKEVERTHPPLGGVRKVVQPFEFNGYTVPAGWSLRLAAIISHYLPDVFENPQTFDPDRFAPPREEDRRTSYSLIGFGAGHRQCTGKPLALTLLQAMLVKMVRDYDWEVPEGQDLTPTLYNRAVFVPKDMLRVRFSKRVRPAPARPPEITSEPAASEKAARPAAAPSKRRAARAKAPIRRKKATAAKTAPAKPTRKTPAKQTRKTAAEQTRKTPAKQTRKSPAKRTRKTPAKKS